MLRTPPRRAGRRDTASTLRDGCVDLVASMTGIDVDVRRIATPRGALHVQRWHAASAGQHDKATTARTPIVLLHDSLGCVELWRDVPQQLVHLTDRDVIAYDRLGFGRSDPHPGRLSHDFIADEALDGFDHVRQALGVRRFIAFGHSVGGGMAVGCAAAFPDDCQALISESAQAFVESRTIEGIVAARESFAKPGQIERLAKYHGDKARWVLDAWIETWLAPGFADWTLDDSLRRVRCPALVVHGELDAFGSARHPQRIASLIADASLHHLPGCGHVPHREQPSIVFALIGDWLARQA